MICRRASKCKPLLRFNPLNLAKIACFAKWVKGAECVPSDFLYKKRSMILTCIKLKDKGSIKITSKLEGLGRALLCGAIGWILTKFAYVTSISAPYAAPKENWSKKITEANFSSLVSDLLYTYLKKSTEKLWAKSILLENSIWGTYRDWLLMLSINKTQIWSLGSDRTVNRIGLRIGSDRTVFSRLVQKNYSEKSCF